jgi:hypothetical protein
VRATGLAVLTMFVVAGCGGPAPTAAHTPLASSSTSASPSAAGSPGASPSSGPASLVHCTASVPAGDNLVIGTVQGDPTVVMRDIQDPANAKNLCTFDSGALTPQFATATSVVYETSPNQIIRADLTTSTTSVVATYATGFGSGQYAVSPDGQSITYLDGNAWRVAGPSGNRALATLPAVPGRGVSPSQDDSFLNYSPDGQYIALFQTFHVGGTGETAADQIRKASDGSLVYSTSGMTMAVWASVPSRLFFRDTSGNMRRWDPSTGVTSMTPLPWIRPRSSPDGRWIAYTFQTGTGVDGVGFYSVQANAQQNTTPPGRFGVKFLNNDLVWYAGEKPCSTNCGPQPSTPTGVTYIYSIAGTSEVTSRLGSVYDAWPRVTAPGL